jgi:hypothetical protein
MTQSEFPSRWIGLLDEDGEIDGFLLTPLGEIGDDLRIMAIRGSYGTDANPDDMAVVIMRKKELALVAARPIQQVFGFELHANDLAAVEAFIEKNFSVLLDHWTGRNDSMELWCQILRKPEV